MKTPIQKITIPESKFIELKNHLFPGDGLEAVSFLICGFATRDDGAYLSAQKVFNIPHGSCVRESHFIQWPVREILHLFEIASRQNLCLIKVHSHPNKFTEFSSVDDQSDRELFPKIYELTKDDLFHASLLMNHDGSLIARHVNAAGEFSDVPKIVVPGADIKFFVRNDGHEISSSQLKRSKQVFGEGTVRKLQGLKVGVVGTSGTGSPVISQLQRNGAGEIVIVDPKISRDVNMNRIHQLKMSDVEAGLYKADVIRADIEASGTPTKVKCFTADLEDEEVIKELSTCDVLFGCMDSVRGRHLLNKISSFYCIPLFDVGVQLKADGFGGVQSVWASFHYLVPGGSSLFSRNVYNMEALKAETIKHEDPQHFEDLEKNKYIKDADESAPAVISVNGAIASFAVMDLLARVHPYRDEPNTVFNAFRINFREFEVYKKTYDGVCPLFERTLSKGDTVPLLGLALNKKVQRDKQTSAEI